MPGADDAQDGVVAGGADLHGNAVLAHVAQGFPQLKPRESRIGWSKAETSGCRRRRAGVEDRTRLCSRLRRGRGETKAASPRRVRPMADTADGRLLLVESLCLAGQAERFERWLIDGLGSVEAVGLLVFGQRPAGERT